MTIFMHRIGILEQGSSTGGIIVSGDLQLSGMSDSEFDDTYFEDSVTGFTSADGLTFIQDPSYQIFYFGTPFEDFNVVYWNGTEWRVSRTVDEPIDWVDTGPTSLSALDSELITSDSATRSGNFCPTPADPKVSYT